MDTTKKCNETDNFSDVIFTPHFRGDRYLHHVCSGCEYKVKIGNDVFNKLYFGETFKFCPNCGSKRPEGKWFCTNCGKENSPEARFCSECGSKK